MKACATTIHHSPNDSMIYTFNSAVSDLVLEDIFMMKYPNKHLKYRGIDIWIFISTILKKKEEWGSYLVKDLRQGSSSFFTLKSSWSVPWRRWISWHVLWIRFWSDPRIFSNFWTQIRSYFFSSYFQSKLFYILVNLNSVFLPFEQWNTCKIGVVMFCTCLFCPSDNFETCLALLTRWRASALPLSYWYLFCDPRRWENSKKVRTPRRVSTSGAPHVVTWTKQTWT